MEFSACNGIPVPELGQGRISPVGRLWGQALASIPRPSLHGITTDYPKPPRGALRKVPGTSSGFHPTSITSWGNHRLPKPPCDALGKVPGTSSGLHPMSFTSWDNHRLPKPPRDALRCFFGKAGAGRGTQNTPKLCSPILCGTPQICPTLWAPSAIQLQTLGQIPHLGQSLSLLLLSLPISPSSLP